MLRLEAARDLVVDEVLPRYTRRGLYICRFAIGGYLHGALDNGLLGLHIHDFLLVDAVDEVGEGELSIFRIGVSQSLNDIQLLRRVVGPDPVQVDVILLGHGPSDGTISFFILEGVEASGATENLMILPEYQMEVSGK